MGEEMRSESRSDWRARRGTTEENEVEERRRLRSMQRAVTEAKATIARSFARLSYKLFSEPLHSRFVCLQLSLTALAARRSRDCEPPKHVIVRASRQRGNRKHEALQR